MKTTMIAALCLLGVGCGGGQKTSDQDQAVVGPPQVAWKDMTKKQKQTYMKKVVIPTMQPLFAAYDKDEFSTITCLTCHGDGATDSTFKMPNPEIMPLPATPEGFQALMAEKPKAVEFMAKQVKPAMAKLLGEPEFDPAHPEAGGFGCMECHTAAK